MNSIAKAGMALGTLSGAGGLGYVAIQQFTTTNDIASKLAKENYQLLDSSSGDWTQILASYKEVIKTKTELKFGNFDGAATNAKQELQRLCNEATKLDLSKDTNNTTYNKAKKWCTKPRKLEDLLNGQRRKFLSTNLNNDEDSGDWDKILDSYISQTADSTKKFSEIDVLTNSKLVKDKTTRNKLRTKCESLKNKNHYEKDFEKEFEQVVLWCSKVG